MYNYNLINWGRKVLKPILSLSKIYQITISLLLLMVTPASILASEIGILRVSNESSAQQILTVSHQYYSCIDFPKQGEKITVEANSFKDIEFAKDGRCDGKQGYFIVFPTIKDQVPPSQGFQMDSDANLKINGGIPNYTSWLEPKGRESISGKKLFVWHVGLPVAPKISIGKTKGSWTIACGGNQSCKKTVFSSFNKGKINDTQWSSEVQEGVSTSITAGVEVETAGVTGKLETTVTSSRNHTTGEALSMVNSTDAFKSEECKIETDMLKYDISYVWQWTISTKVGDGDITSTSCVTTCTPDGVRPDFLPGSPKSLNACKYLKGEKRPSFAAEKTSVVKAKPVKKPFSDCVTFYSGIGGGESVRLCIGDKASIEYQNLGQPNSNSLHHSVKSFKCGADIKYVQFINGNHSPWSRHNEQCQGESVVKPNVWVTINATGAGIYR